MNARVSKKIRKYSQRAWVEYYVAMKGWPLSARLRFAWQLIFRSK